MPEIPMGKGSEVGYLESLLNPPVAPAPEPTPEPLPAEPEE
jgi:hypothetical protein